MVGGWLVGGLDLGGSHQSKETAQPFLGKTLWNTPDFGPWVDFLCGDFTPMIH